jgi:hypothetical protein
VCLHAIVNDVERNVPFAMALYNVQQALAQAHSKPNNQLENKNNVHGLALHCT